VLLVLRVWRVARLRTGLRTNSAARSSASVVCANAARIASSAKIWATRVDSA